MPAVDAGFSAVSTTGIYCRPGCGARPHPEHVERFRFAAAAEAAGYRACLRCRPYQSSDPVDWMEGPELVCRAVRMVVDGALDEATEAQLAARLGLSARHLRRLFAEHVGATPDQVARSRRAHFARRLLDETDLTVADIAFASGFGSVRQLNRSMREIFRAAPKELRARRRRSDRLVADGGLRLRLAYRPPLDWDAALRFFERRAVPGVELVDGAAYRRTMVVDGDPGMVEVTRGSGDHLVLSTHLPHWDALIHHVRRVRRLFDLDADPGRVAGGLARVPDVHRLVAARPGLRLPGTWDPFETGVRAILGQQIGVGAATTIAGRLVERLGAPVRGLGTLGLTHTFPASEVVATGDLEGVGLTGRRADTIRGFARAVAEDRLRLDGGPGLDSLVASLTALPGIGRWTAHYLALRMGESDAFPATDLGLRRAAGRGRDLMPTAAELEARVEAGRPWRAYAATHLWHSLEDAGPIDAGPIDAPATHTGASTDRIRRSVGSESYRSATRSVRTPA